MTFFLIMRVLFSDQQKRTASPPYSTTISSSCHTRSDIETELTTEAPSLPIFYLVYNTQWSTTVIIPPSCPTTALALLTPPPIMVTGSARSLTILVNWSALVKRPGKSLLISILGIWPVGMTGMAYIDSCINRLRQNFYDFDETPIFCHQRGRNMTINLGIGSGKH